LSFEPAPVATGGVPSTAGQNVLAPEEFTVMRVSYLLSAAAFMAAVLATGPGRSASPAFDLTGTWAAGGKACSEAELFLEFDGRNILASQGPSTKSPVAQSYSASLDGDRLVVSLTKADTKEGDAWSFVVDRSDAIRLDSAFFASSDGRGLMNLTRCPRA
jgi:hypothetical protein